MSLIEVKNRVDQLGSAWEKFKEVNEVRLKEIDKLGSSDPLIEMQLSSLNKEIDECKSRIVSIEATEQRPSYDENNYVSSRYSSEYKKAFTDYLRKGMDSNLPGLEKKYLSGYNTDTNGGYLASPHILDSIAQKLNTLSPMRFISNVVEISLDSLEYVEDAEDTDSGWSNGTTAITDTNNSSSVAKKKILVNSLYTQPKATQRLIDDPAIDIESWLIDKISTSFALKENKAFVSGDGTDKPKGILSYEKGTGAGQIEQVKSGTNSDFNTDNIIKLYYSLKDVYTNNASFLMHRSVIEKARLFKDTSGRYIWNPSFISAKPDTLFGVPLYSSPDMPEAGNNSLSVVVADFKKAYQIVDNPGVRILRDYFTAKPFVKFYATKRVGGAVIDTNAVKILALKS